MNTAIPTIKASPEEIYDIELEHSLLEANAKIARNNRSLLDNRGITAIDFMGAIGSGKTTLITKLSEMLKDRTGVAVFNGDATTSNDADNIARLGVPVVQIATVNGCHLDANLVEKALKKIDLAKTSLIFIENIGNLICPAEFPLGSKARVVVVSVTEGPYMVKKHPHMFLGANIVVINKTDLAEAMGVSVEELKNDVHMLKPDIKVIMTSCKTGVGVEEVAGGPIGDLRDIMHEFSIATSIMESVLTFAQDHPNATVLKVRVWVGELTCVDSEQLRFCYHSIIPETLLAGSELEIELVPATVRCQKCSYEGCPKYWEGTLADISIPTLQCPRCSNAVEPTQGHECEIKSVQILEQEEAAAAPG